MVVRVGATCDFVNVLPLQTINDFLVANRSFQLPLNPNSQDLTSAAYKGDETRFYQLLEQVGDPNTSDAYGGVPLERVATTYNNFYAFITASGLQKADGTIPDTACAVWTDTRVRMAKALLDKGARPDGKPGASWTPLMSAVIADSQCDNTKMVDTLLQGADPNHLYVSSSSGTKFVLNPLMLAVEDGRVATVEHLLAKGAVSNVAVDAWTGHDVTPLFALAVDDTPDANGTMVNFDEPGLDPYCWNKDNAKVAKFRLLLPHTDLLAVLDKRDDYMTKDFVGLTVEGILEKRLGGGCTYNTCDGSGRDGRGRCLERMLGALLAFKK